MASGQSMAQQNYGSFRSGSPSANGHSNRNQPNRTTWQPVRPVQATEELPGPAIKSEPVPMPVPIPERPSAGSSMHGERSILQNPGSTFFNGPMDGEIVYEGDFTSGAHFHDDYACDAIGGCDGHCGTVGGCHDGCCAPGASHAWRPCLTICLPENGWVSFEYLGWWQRGMALPPLVTTSTGTPLPPAANAGVLGRGPTRVLFGGEDVLEDGFSGGRLQFGFWLDRCHTWAAAAEYFELGSRTEEFAATSNGNPVLARPFVNVLNGLNDSQVIAYPGVATGGIRATASSSLVGGGFHFRRQTNCHSGCGKGVFCDGCSTFHSRTDVLFGYRYLQLDEAVNIHETLNGVPGDSFRLHDRFRTFNQFNGFDMGITYERFRGPWSFDLLAKLALGNTRQRVDINGSTAINGGAAQPGGLLAQTSNIGTYRRDHFTVLPELGGRIGYQLTHNLRLRVGYTLIFWSNVVRPGDQIDLGVNPNQFPPAVGNTPGRPEFVFRDTDYWVQGITFGGEFQW